ncbi:MAG: TIGR00725 family protein [candidate division Zixibacteria bacterium]|nr:TIGR00725 family protein [candidate division Zixibacteria bacterium]
MAIERKPVIAIVGAGKCSKKLRDNAAIVARYVAKNGGVVVCGGLEGIMEGAARGAWEGGGVSIGILPGEDRNDANKFITYAIPTGFGEARNIMVIRMADVVVAFPGKYGTLSEMAFALKAGKPVISISAWKVGEDIISMDDPTEAAEKAMELAQAALEE